MRSMLKIAALLVIGMSSVALAQTAMQKEVVNPENAPPAIGPYSQGIKFGDTLYVSGQIPIDPKTKEVMAGAPIEDQTKLVIENIRAVLVANGMTLDDVVATQVFLKDMNEFPKMNAVYAEFFKSKPPARATVEVARLPRDVRIEIAATARR